ncbi:hypothetical protein ACFC1R_30495 [Kitasatospora sp. NPDC056138]|uniref:hypothetical protein n=1 Tax=Kitasatospora sp. NPDC056138 TaxID=3345724 RepID=UPI0035D8F6C1
MERYIPAAWAVATPEAVLTVRPRGAGGPLRRCSGRKVRRGRCAVRSGLSAPEESHRALGHAAKMLREHRTRVSSPP